MSATPLNLPAGTVMVVRDDLVSGLSQSGYRLIAVVTDAEPVPRDVKVKDPYGATVHNTEYEMGSVSRYVMHLDEESALAAACATAQFQEELARGAEEKQRAAEQCTNVALKKHGELEERFARLGRDAAASREEVLMLRKVNARLEDDIGKVQEAVGAIKMKEILGQ